MRELCRKASRMKHNGRVEKLLCELSQNVQPRLSCFDDVVGSGRLYCERSRQQVLGIEQKVHQAMENDPRRAKQYSVRLELQADCFAGVGGHSTQERNLHDPGEV